MPNLAFAIRSLSLLVALAPAVPWVLAGYQLRSRGELSSLSVQSGPAEPVLILLTQALMAVGLLVLIWDSAHPSRLLRRQNLMIAGAMLLGLIAYWIHEMTAEMPLNRYVGVTPIAILIAASTLFFFFRSYSQFSVLPAARDAVLEAMSEGVLVTDLQGALIDWNGAATGEECEYHLFDRVVEITRSPFRRADETLGHFLLLREVTAKRRYEEGLRESTRRAQEAARAQAEFLASMSHEIRTPLNGVTGMAHLLRDTKLDIEQHEMVATLEHSAQSLTALVNDILDYSKIEAGEMAIEEHRFAPEQLMQTLAALLRPQAEAKGIGLRITMEPGIPAALRGDALRLQQVLLNLVGNAVKFTSEGAVEIRLAWSVGRLRADVLDTGIGFGEIDPQRLFQRFVQADSSTTRRFGGTGLSLAICHRLVELMGGQIGAMPNSPRGARFWFELPLGAVVETEPVTAALRRRSGFRRRRASTCPSSRSPRACSKPIVNVAAKPAWMIFSPRRLSRDAAAIPNSWRSDRSPLASRPVK